MQLSNMPGRVEMQRRGQNPSRQRTAQAPDPAMSQVPVPPGGQIMWAPEQKLLFSSALNKATLSLHKTQARNAASCFGSEQADLCIAMKKGELIPPPPLNLISF